MKNQPGDPRAAPRFSFGGTLAKPARSRMVSVRELVQEAKWTRYPNATMASVKAETTLGDLFDVKRGLATGDNSFFIMDAARIKELGLPMECFTPVLPGSRYLPEDEIDADKNGLPLIDKQLFLLDTKLGEEEIAAKYPALQAYLNTGKKGEKPVADRYLSRTRKPWYAQEKRPAAPLICTYMGRSRNGSKPFRFILNNSSATACNVFLMLYPKAEALELMEQNPDFVRDTWDYLNSIESDVLVAHGRVYGGGLHKLEPKELRSLSVDALVAAQHREPTTRVKEVA